MRSTSVYPIYTSRLRFMSISYHSISFYANRGKLELATSTTRLRVVFLQDAIATVARKSSEDRRES